MDYKQCSLFALFVCFTALAERQRLSANDKQCNLFAVFVCIFRIAERQRLSANDKQCSLFALFVYGHHAGSRCSANNDGFLKEIACGVVNIGARNNNLACFKAHLAGAVADMGDFAVCFDIVAGIDGCYEFDHVICFEQAFIAVALDEKFGCNVAEKGKHVCAVNKISAVMSILRAHAKANGGCDFLFHFMFLRGIIFAKNGLFGQKTKKAPSTQKTPRE